MHSGKADVLLLLDSYYSARAARGRAREDSGKCELLAACAMNLQTPPPGPASFTTALLREMSEMLASTSQIVTSELAYRLGHRRASLGQTPVHVDMSLGHLGHSIRWKPFRDVEKTNLHITDAVSYMKLRVAMGLSRSNDDRSLHDLIQWLKIEVPSWIRGIAIEEILHHTEQLQYMMLQQDSSASNSSLALSMNNSQKEEVLDVWQDVQNLFAEACQTWIPTAGLDSFERVSQLKEQIRNLVKELELRNNSVIRRLEAALMTLQHEAFENVASSSSAKFLGLDSLLRLRRLIKNPPRGSSLEINAKEIRSVNGEYKSAPASKNLIMGTLGQLNVLIEYESYEESIDQVKMLRRGRKINKLVQILHCDKPTYYCSLKCLHWFHDSHERRYGLVFEMPFRLSVAYTVLSELLDPIHTKDRPTLGQRFRIAYDVGYAIQRWHAVGWVHEEICSRNISIFQNPETQAWDYSKPFLGGFLCSRREVGISDGHEVHDIEKIIHRHPSHQNISIKKHDALHDVYAYGVLLLEIGLWQTVLEHRDVHTILREAQNQEPGKIRETLINLAKQLLGHTMGADYRDAVLTCLEPDSQDLWNEYRAQPELAQTFTTHVLDRVAKGCELK